MRVVPGHRHSGKHRAGDAKTGEPTSRTELISPIRTDQPNPDRENSGNRRLAAMFSGAGG